MTVYYGASSATQRVRISIKDNELLGLIDENKKHFWVSFSTFLRPQSHHVHQSGDNGVVANTARGATVSILIHHLHSILNLGEGTSLSLSVDGYFLPDNEALDIIHETDIVVVDLEPNMHTDVMMEKKVGMKPFRLHLLT